jgi:hypothetical protein
MLNLLCANTLLGSDTPRDIYMLVVYLVPHEPTYSGSGSLF